MSTLAGQQYGPRDCCLCSANARIAKLEAENLKLRQLAERLMVELQKAQGSCIIPWR